MVTQDAKHDILPIPAYKFFAVEQRYQGSSSGQIACDIQGGFDVLIHPGTIRNWFANGGELRVLYDEYAESMNEARMEMTKNYFQAHAIKAAKTLMAVMEGRGGVSQVAAAKVFLDRAFGKVKNGAIEESTEKPFTLKEFIEMTASNQ